MLKRFGVALVVFGFLMATLCIIGATEGLIDYLRNSKPLRISLAEYIRTRPGNQWVELTDCDIAYSRAFGWQNSQRGEVRDISVPVTARGMRGGSITLVLHVAPDHASAFIGRSVHNDPNGVIAGMISTGFLGTGLGIDEKVNLPDTWALADPFAVVNEGEKPGLVLVVAGYGVGLILLACAAAGVSTLRADPAQKERDAFKSLLGADPAAALERAFQDASAPAGSKTPAWRESEKTPSKQV